MYRPRPPKKNFLSYFIPFIIIISIFVGVIYIFQSVILKKEYFKNTFATLSPGEIGTQVMLSGSEEWSSVSRKIKIFKGDVIKTSGFASINLIGETKINLDKGSIILIEKLQSNNSSSQVKTIIPEGRVWFDIKRMINPKSLFEIKSGNLLLSTRHGIFSVNGNSVRVVEGGVDVAFYEGKKEIGKMKVGIGQELILSESDLNSLKIGTMPTVRAINDEFKLSSWYSKNYINNGKIIETDKLENLEISKEIISGTGDIIGENVEKNTENIENNIENKDDKNISEKSVVKKAEHKGEITLDVEKTEIEIFNTEIVNLFGKVPEGTNSVKVNDWKLGKFEAGNTTWRYNGALKWENLKEGENIYKVEVFDEDNLKFAEKEFKIFVKIKEEIKEEEIKEEIKEEKTEEKKIEEEVEKKAGNGEGVSTDEDISEKSDIEVETSLQIISHKEGEFVKILEGQSLEIKGIPSTGTEKIKVGDYTLKGFKKGDKNFIFRIAEEWGNAKIGEKNKFKITSFDDKGKEIETLNFSLFIEE